jgi:hypothetical protein
VDFPLVPTKSDKQFKRVQETQPAATVKIERVPPNELLVRVRNVTSREDRVFPLTSVDELVRYLAELNRMASSVAGEGFFPR